MSLKKKFAVAALLGLGAYGAYSMLSSDAPRAPIETVTIQPSKDTLTQVAFLDKHFSLRETARSFQDRFHSLAKELSRAEVSLDTQNRLTVVGNQLDAKGDGKVSNIANPALQQRVSTGTYEIIKEGFETLRKGNEKAFDAALKQPEHQRLSVMYKDLKNSETMWRATNANAPTVVNIVSAAPVIAAPVVAAPAPNIVLAQAPNLPPQNGQIYIPADNGAPQFKGFTGEARRLKGLEEKNEREQKQIQANYGANNYGFGRQPEDIAERMRDLPGVFTGEALTSMALIGREMAALSGDAKLRADLTKRVNELERDTAGVGKDEMKAQGSRTLTKVNTNNPEVLKILKRSYDLGMWMVGPGQKQLFEKALLSRNTRNPAQTKAGIQGAANIDYINTSSYRVLMQKSRTPAPNGGRP